MFERVSASGNERLVLASFRKLSETDSQHSPPLVLRNFPVQKKMALAARIAGFGS